MWQISYPPANGACPGSYFWGACAQQQKYWRFSPKMAVLRQKQAKWGQSKWLLHPNLQTFFDEVIIFGLVGDEVKTCRKIVSGARALRKKYCRSSPKTTVFRAKIMQKWAN